MSTIATNRKARRDYEIFETLDAGIQLVGSEVKSIRQGRVNLKDSFARFDGHELFLHHVHISHYSHAGPANHEPERVRKLLLHRRELATLWIRLQQRGFTLVPLRMYLHRGLVKVELGVARGKRQYDKRKSIKTREHEREMLRAQRRTGR